LPQFWGGMTFFRPVPPGCGTAKWLSRTGMESRIMLMLKLTRREWIFNVLGLLMLLAVGIV